MAAKTDVEKKFEDAFMTLYAQRPIEKITITMVAEEAGLNRCTFYLHYDDIYDLRDRIVARHEQVIQRRMQTVMEALLQDRNIADTFRGVEEYKEDLDHLRILFCVPGKSVLPERMKQEFKDALRGSLRPDAACPEYVLEYAACAIAGVLIHWFGTGCDAPIEEIGSFILDATQHGLRGYFTH